MRRRLGGCPSASRTRPSYVARSAEVQEAYAPLRASHEAFVNKVREHAQDLGRVVLVDLTHDREQLARSG